MDTRNKLEIICKNAFFNCTSLTAFSYYFPGFSGLEIEDRLSEIEDYAFGNCKWLTEVALYSMRIDIANNAFDGCDNVYFFCREKSDVEAFALQKGFRFYHFSN